MEYRLDPRSVSVSLEDRIREALLPDIASPADLRALPRAALEQVSDELRSAVVETVSATGGHLGAGLGVVELTVALHYTFDTPDDILVWDVSHQCYPHKILTGRRPRMSRLRQAGGASGFTTRAESAFDPFGAAHSSTAISAALGFATARDLQNKSYNVVAVVGDGAMSGGMAFEGLNNAGAQKRRLVVVLNDNDMSIAPPSGALSEYLRDLRACLPDKSVRQSALARGELPDFSGRATLFGDLGLRYAGPFDGHDVGELVEVMRLARDYQRGPVLLHILTEKGHGYAPAASAPDKGHGVEKFDIATGKQSKAVARAPSYTAVFAKALIEEASRDPSIVAITAAMPTGTGLDKFGQAFPDRCFDVGIAEQHAVTFAAGMACKGMKPFAAIYSTFLQRAYDQVVHDVAIQRLPVRFAIDRAGLVGSDGVTHHGSFDVSYLGCLPGFVLMAPADEAELVDMVTTAVAIDDRPCAFRYPRGEGTGAILPARGTALDIGRGRIVREGADVAILSYGTRLSAALEAANALARVGISATVADARFAKPVDARLVATLLHEHPLVLTVEEGAGGGFASLVLDAVARHGLAGAAGKLRSLYLPDEFIDHDTQSSQLARAGLDATAIAAQIIELSGLRHALAVAAEANGARPMVALAGE